MSTVFQHCVNKKKKMSRLTPHIQATCAMTRYILYFSLDFPLDFADFRDIKEVHKFAGASLAPGGGQGRPESAGGSYLRGKEQQTTSLEVGANPSLYCRL